MFFLQSLSLNVARPLCCVCEGRGCGVCWVMIPQHNQTRGITSLFCPVLLSGAATGSFRRPWSRSTRMPHGTAWISFSVSRSTVIPERSSNSSRVEKSIHHDQRAKHAPRVSWWRKIFLKSRKVLRTLRPLAVLHVDNAFPNWHISSR